MTAETLIGIVASALTAVSALPQLVKLLKEKKQEGISFGMLGVLVTGLAFWTWYGFLKEDVILIISNAFSMLVNSAVLLLGFHYRKGKTKR